MKNSKYIIGCTTIRPENNDDWLERKVNEFLAMDGGWLVFKLHRLDNEGWGPMRTDYFTCLLQKLVEIKKLEVIAVGMALEKYSS